MDHGWSSPPRLSRVANGRRGRGRRRRDRHCRPDRGAQPTPPSRCSASASGAVRSSATGTAPASTSLRSRVPRRQRERSHSRPGNGPKGQQGTAGVQKAGGTARRRASHPGVCADPNQSPVRSDVRRSGTRRAEPGAAERPSPGMGASGTGEGASARRSTFESGPSVKEQRGRRSGARYRPAETRGRHSGRSGQRGLPVPCSSPWSGHRRSTRGP